MTTTTILIVDRDPHLRDLITFLLKDASSDYDVIEVGSGTEAMKQVSKNAIDLVILEWMLPDTPGNEVCQAIKRYYNDNFVPILMLTARSGLADRVAGLDAGADDFLTKPFHSDELMARVRSLLRIRKSELNRIRVIRELEIARDELREAILKEEANTVTVQFEFNDAVKVSCQQYLLYFVEFLRDIGIDATADLQEDAGQVLFSVTPKDKDEALDNIREALAIYLRLPMSRNTTVVVSPDTSIEVQKLSAQLHHFQGQLYLASAALQQKELTIQQQGTTIHYQQSLIEQQIASGQVLVQALQKEADDAEPVGGIVKVKAWSIDGIPIELDLPTLMRMLKERFKRRRFE